jgi:hypothetical protein
MLLLVICASMSISQAMLDNAFGPAPQRIHAVDCFLFELYDVEIQQQLL